MDSPLSLHQLAPLVLLVVVLVVGFAYAARP
jgi:hypothetical protein